jgi:hypothetical protein
LFGDSKQGGGGGGGEVMVLEYGNGDDIVEASSGGCDG